MTTNNPRAGRLDTGDYLGLLRQVSQSWDYLGLPRPKSLTKIKLSRSPQITKVSFKQIFTNIWIRSIINVSFKQILTKIWINQSIKSIKSINKSIKYPKMGQQYLKLCQKYPKTKNPKNPLLGVPIEPYWSHQWGT